MQDIKKITDCSFSASAKECYTPFVHNVSLCRNNLAMICAHLLLVFFGGACVITPFRNPQALPP